MKGAVHIDMMVLIIIAVVVIVAIVTLVVTGVTNPGGDLAKSAVVRTCCQVNMPMTCSSDASAITCSIPQNMIPSLCSTDKCTLLQVAEKINIRSSDIRKFCGCT